jgi:hypothetical protein
MRQLLRILATALKLSALAFLIIHAKDSPRKKLPPQVVISFEVDCKFCDFTTLLKQERSKVITLFSAQTFPEIRFLC